MKLTRDQKSSIKHALRHLEANKIIEENTYEGWYCGNLEQFRKRHIKAIALLTEMLAERG